MRECMNLKQSRYSRSLAIILVILLVIGINPSASSIEPELDVFNSNVTQISENLEGNLEPVQSRTNVLVPTGTTLQTTGVQLLESVSGIYEQLVSPGASYEFHNSNTVAQALSASSTYSNGQRYDYVVYNLDNTIYSQKLNSYDASISIPTGGRTVVTVLGSTSILFIGDGLYISGMAGSTEAFYKKTMLPGESFQFNNTSTTHVQTFYASSTYGNGQRFDYVVFYKESTVYSQKLNSYDASVSIPAGASIVVTVLESSGQVVFSGNNTHFTGTTAPGAAFYKQTVQPGITYEFTNSNTTQVQNLFASSTSSNGQRYDYAIYKSDGSLSSQEVSSYDSSIGIPISGKAIVTVLATSSVIVFSGVNRYVSGKQVIDAAFYKKEVPSGESFKFVNGTASTQTLFSNSTSANGLRYDYVVYDQNSHNYSLELNSYDGSISIPASGHIVTTVLGSSNTLTFSGNSQYFSGVSAEGPAFYKQSVSPTNSFEYANNSTNQSQTLLASSTSANGQRYDYVVYQQDGSTYSQGLNSYSGSIGIPAGGKGIITVSEASTDIIFSGDRKYVTGQTAQAAAFIKQTVASGESYIFRNSNTLQSQTLYTSSTSSNGQFYDHIAYKSNAETYSYGQGGYTGSLTIPAVGYIVVTALTTSTGIQFSGNSLYVSAESSNLPAYDYVTVPQGESYEFTNYHAMTKSVLSSSTSANGQLYDYCVYEQNGTLYSQKLASYDYYVNIPAGGKAIVTTSSSIAVVFSGDSRYIVGQSDSGPAFYKKTVLPGESYEFDNNNGTTTQTLYSSSTSTNSQRYDYVVYKQDGTLYSQEPNSYDASIGIPAGGKVIVTVLGTSPDITFSGNSRYIIGKPTTGEALYKLTAAPGESHEFTNSSASTQSLYSTCTSTNGQRYDYVMYKQDGSTYSQALNNYNGNISLLAGAKIVVTVLDTSSAIVFSGNIQYITGKTAMDTAFIKQIAAPGSSYKFTNKNVTQSQTLYTSSNSVNSQRYSYISYKSDGSTYSQNPNTYDSNISIPAGGYILVTVLATSTDITYCGNRLYTTVQDGTGPVYYSQVVAPGQSYAFSNNNSWSLKLLSSSTSTNRQTYDYCIYNADGTVASKDFRSYVNQTTISAGGRVVVTVNSDSAEILFSGDGQFISGTLSTVPALFVVNIKPNESYTFTNSSAVTQVMLRKGSQGIDGTVYKADGSVSTVYGSSTASSFEILAGGRTTLVVPQSAGSPVSFYQSYEIASRYIGSQQNGAVAGRVINATGIPLAYIDVLVWDMGSKIKANAFTDANGRYIIHGLPGGSYKVQCNPYISWWYNNKADSVSADTVTVVPGQVTDNIDFQIDKLFKLYNSMDLAFVLDSSGSMATSDPANYRGSESQVLINNFRDADRGAVVDFDTDAILKTGFTANKNILFPAVVVDSSGDTDILEGIWTALSQFETTGRKETNRIILLLTDGNDNYPSVAEYDAAIRSANLLGVRIFSIGLGTSINEALLMKISNRTFGKFYYYNNAGEMGDGFAQFAAEIGLPILRDFTGINGIAQIAKNNPAQTDPQSLRQDPINLATGAHEISRSILKLNGAQNLDFTINYNSLLNQTDVLGKGWGFNHETRLEELLDGRMMVHWNANRGNYFNPINVDQYSPADRAIQNSILTRNVDGSHTLVHYDNPSGVVTYVFDNQGKLQTQTNMFGQEIGYTYNSSGQLITVSEPASGQYYTLIYNVDGFLNGVEDSLARSVTFLYDAQDNLIGISDADGVSISYSYNDKGWITNATYSTGKVLFTDTYDANGRVVTQTDALSGLSTFIYDTASQPGEVITTVTDREGNTEVVTHDSRYQLKSIQDGNGNATTYDYDANGNRTSSADANGNTTTMTYDERGNMLSSTDVDGNATTMTYDDRNNLLSVTDALGHTTTFSYDSNNNLLSMTDAEGNQTSYTYDANSQITSRTLPDQGTSRFSYTNGLMTTSTDPAGVVTTYSYDAAGRVVAITDEDGNTTSISYDAKDRPLTITGPLGSSVSYSYDSHGNKLSEIDGNGNTTTYTYNANNKMISMRDALGTTTTYGYDGEDRLTSITDGRGNTQYINYDAAGRAISTTDGEGNTTSLDYDGVGNITGITDPTGASLTTAFNNLNLPISITDSLGNTLTKDYDAIGRITSVTDPMGKSSTYSYDQLNRLSRVTDPMSGTSQQSFDGSGNRLSLTDPNGNNQGFSYDNAGRIVSESDGAGGTISYTYNQLGQIATRTNGRGDTATFSYDRAGRVITMETTEGTTTYSYDNNNNLTGVSDSSGSISRSNDALNRVTSYRDINGNTISYQYDGVGNLIELTYPDDKTVSYSYDRANRMIGVNDWAGRTTSYSYDDAGRLITTNRPDGSIQTNSYDGAGQLLQQVDQDATGKVIAQYDFTYDESGNVISEVSSTTPATFSLDNATMTYGAGNRLDKFNGQSVTYDADGNMTNGHLQGVLADFSYDSRNRLIGAGDTTYSYDPENNRVGQTNSSGTTQYVINPQAYLSQVLQITKGTDTSYLVYGLGLLGVEDSTGNYQAYHYDRRGSTVAITNIAGETTDTFTFGPYAELVGRTGETVTPFLYNGREGVMTDSIGLYYMRARYYNSEIKRFVNQDVLLGTISNSPSLNRYAYVNGQPVSMIDPWGLSAWSQMKQAGNDIYGVYLQDYEDGIMSYDQQMNELVGNDTSLRTNVLAFTGKSLNGISQNCKLALNVIDPTNIGKVTSRITLNLTEDDSVAREYYKQKTDAAWNLGAMAYSIKGISRGIVELPSAIKSQYKAQIYLNKWGNKINKGLKQIRMNRIQESMETYSDILDLFNYIDLGEQAC